MLRPFAVLLLAACLPQLHADDLEKPLTEIVESSQKAWDVPGVAVVVTRGEEVVLMRGFGVRESGKADPVTADTVFPLASCSKAFTSTLLGILADDGKLSLDDPVRKHLPDFRLFDPLANRDVALRDLLCHRTGVAGHDLLWLRSKESLETIVGRAAHLRPEKPFRTAMQYQSIMYTAAGLSAAKAAGESWEVLLRDKIFEPLGMKTAGVRSANAMKIADRATGHRIDAGGERVRTTWYDDREANPAGSVFASVRDLSRWLILQTSDGIVGETPIIARRTLREIQSPHQAIGMDDLLTAEHPDTALMSYALGYVVQDYRGEKLISHAGIIDGFRAHIALIPREKIGIAILCNLDRTRFNLALSNRLVDRLLEKSPRDWDTYHRAIVADTATARRVAERRRAAAADATIPPTLPLKDHVGAWDDPAYGRCRVSLEKDRLVWEWNGFRLPLKPFRGDVWQLSDDSGLLDGELLEFAVKQGSVREVRAISRRFVRDP